jgi:hypothetical protein
MKMSDEERKEAPQFYTVQEVAAKFKLSEKVIRRLVKDAPEVMRLYGTGLLMGTAKRAHVTLRIPESVVLRIREQLTQPLPKPAVSIGESPSDPPHSKSEEGRLTNPHGLRHLKHLKF